MNIIGIDPGISGGIVVLNDRREIVYRTVMPSVEVKKQNKIKHMLDISKLHKIILELKSLETQTYCYLEKVNAMPKQGVVSMFNFGYCFGAIEAIIIANSIPYNLITPQAWSKSLHQGLSKDIDPKDRSILVVKRLFPNVNLLATSRSTKLHSGLVDSLLIAEYGLRTMNNEDSNG